MRLLGRRAGQTAALAPRKEVPSLIPGTSSRPADVYLPNWTRGKPAALDVHVISTLQQLTLKEAAVTQGHALSVGEERKRAAHSEACHAVGVTFIPMVVETLGGWGEEAALTVKNIGRLQDLRLGIPPRPSNSTPFSAAGHQSVEEQRHPLDPPPPHSITGGGRANLTFIFCA